MAILQYLLFVLPCGRPLTCMSVVEACEIIQLRQRNGRFWSWSMHIRLHLIFGFQGGDLLLFCNFIVLSEEILNSHSHMSSYALSFFGSKMILDCPNNFGRVPIVLERSKL